MRHSLGVVLSNCHILILEHGNDLVDLTLASAGHILIIEGDVQLRWHLHHWLVPQVEVWDLYGKFGAQWVGLRRIEVLLEVNRHNGFLFLCDGGLLTLHVSAQTVLILSPHTVWPVGWDLIT